MSQPPSCPSQGLWGAGPGGRAGGEGPEDGPTGGRGSCSRLRARGPTAQTGFVERIPPLRTEQVRSGFLLRPFAAPSPHDGGSAEAEMRFGYEEPRGHLPGAKGRFRRTPRADMEPCAHIPEQAPPAPPPGGRVHTPDRPAGCRVRWQVPCRQVELADLGSRLRPAPSDSLCDHEQAPWLLWVSVSQSVQTTGTNDSSSYPGLQTETQGERTERFTRHMARGSGGMGSRDCGHGDGEIAQDAARVPGMPSSPGNAARVHPGWVPHTSPTPPVQRGPLIGHVAPSGLCRTWPCGGQARCHQPIPDTRQ